MNSVGTIRRVPRLADNHWRMTQVFDPHQGARFMVKRMTFVPNCFQPLNATYCQLRSQ